MLVFTGIFTFLVDAYPHYAASAMAANTFTRCTLAGELGIAPLPPSRHGNVVLIESPPEAAFPLFGLPMYSSLGYQWGSTVLAFLTVAMLPFPYLFFRHGKTIRRRSKFAASQ